MKLSVLAGSTSQSVNIFIQDSSVTTGAGLSGLVFNTASLIAYYALPRAAPVAITLATLASATAAYSSGGFFELDATHAKGLYRLDIPNAALASGRFCTIYLSGAANMAPCVLEIELTGWDNQDGVRGGCTALPNVASGSAGAIPTTGTGANQISVSSGAVIVQSGTGTGQFSLTSGKVSLAAAGLDAVVVETSLNARQALSVIAAACAGVCAGGGTSTVTFAGAGVATNRVSAACDSAGNRSTVTLNAPA